MPTNFGRNITISAENLSRQTERVRYEQQVAGILSFDIYLSPVGRIVIDSIQQIRRRRLHIKPWTARDENAEAVALDFSGSAPRGEIVRNDDGTVFATGTGVGTSSEIRYSPNRFTQNLRGLFNDSMPAPAVQADTGEVLLHEMCHGLQHILGVQTMRRMPDGLQDDAEFFAALVTNIHSSTRNRPLLADHASTVLTQPENWLNRPAYRTKIQQFIRLMPNLTTKLSKVKAAFNPFNALGKLSA